MKWSCMWCDNIGLVDLFGLGITMYIYSTMFTTQLARLHSAYKSIFLKLRIPRREGVVLSRLHTVRVLPAANLK